ncbi:hypothetical protein BJX99DRAFT_56374 [Aspergillus californicus]
MLSCDEDCGNTPPRTVPFSMSIRSSRRRRSRLARPATLPLTCEESAHYPIFNPQDPRHNPAIRTNACLEDSDDLPQKLNHAGSIRWMQSLPGRSLRRARSGLQAIRSGFHRRPGNLSTDGDTTAINGVWSSSDSAEGSSDPCERLFSSTVSEASTEEDYDFGTDLYRTSRKYPELRNELSRPICPPYVPRPHPAPLPVVSTGGDVPQLSPADTTSARSRETLPTAATEPNTSGIVERPGITAIEECMETSTTDAAPETPDEHPNSPTQELQPNDSPVTDDSDVVLSIKENGASFSSVVSPDPLTPPVESEETSVNCDSDESSSVLCQFGDDEIPYSASISEKSEASRESGTSVLESLQIESMEDMELIHDVEIGPATQPELLLPETELSGHMDVMHLLSLSTIGGNDAFRSRPCEERSSPASLSEDDANAPLSPWLPTDKGDRSSLLSMRDEYFLVDGKSTDLRPDRGDNPIKGERVFSGDGAIHSGPGLDRHLSNRTREIPEIIGPGGAIGVPSPRPLRRDRDGSDSTEEYLVTYSLLHRHYFS